MALALPVALLALLGMAGCTDAGLCRTGSEGCRPNDDGRCDDMLVRMGDLCVNPDQGGTSGGTDATGGTGTGGTGTGGTDATGGSGGGGGTSAAADCAADTVEAACALFCDAFCANQEALCIASKCSDTECAPGGMLFEYCLGQCDSPECAESLCRNEYARTCEDFAYRNDEADASEPWKPGCYQKDPKCVIHGEDRCSDSCGTTIAEGIDPAGSDSADDGVGGELVGNKQCEDGGDASSDLCPRGTDCTDCGVRTCIAQGETCRDSEDCCGYYGDGAFCVNVGTVATPDNRCLLSCTKTKTCPDSFVCTMVSNNRDFVCAPK